MRELLSSSRQLSVALAVLLLPAFTVAQPAPSRTERTRLVLLDFEANGASAELATAATGLAANELQSFGAFDVLTSDAVRGVLAVERQKQLLGCSDDESSCLTELAGAFGADWLILGRVSKVQDLLTLELSLVDARAARRHSSVAEQAKSEAELLSRIAPAVSKVVAPLLGASLATLLIDAAEAGGTVRLDGTVLGTTPLQGQLQVPPGTHLLEVEKEGFVSYRKQVRLAPGEVRSEPVTLVPSPDFISAYESRHSKLRLGAWIATGAAVVGAAGTAYFQLQAQQLYGAPEQEGTFLFHRARVTDGVADSADREHWTSANELRGRIQRNETFSWISGGAGAVAAATAVTLWIVGDDPDRYARFRTVSVGVAPGSGGGAQLNVGGVF